MSEELLTNARYSFAKTLEDIRPKLKPPVSNHLMYGKDDEKLKVMVVAGPNTRKDYHLNEGEELFYQMKGKCDLKIIQNGVYKTITINEGHMFTLPSRIPHSPQRYENTLGLVIERERLENETDGLRWYVEGKEDPQVLYEEYFHCDDLGKQLKPIIESFLNSEIHRTNVPSVNVPHPHPPIVQDNETLVYEPFHLQTGLATCNPFCADTLTSGKEFCVKIFKGKVIIDQFERIFDGNIPKQILFLSFDTELGSIIEDKNIVLTMADYKWDMSSGDIMYFHMEKLLASRSDGNPNPFIHNVNFHIDQASMQSMLCIYNTTCEFSQ
jgi:3-hydroxyanthranilate 3,4-dioxygenase